MSNLLIALLGALMLLSQSRWLWQQRQNREPQARGSLSAGLVALLLVSLALLCVPALHWFGTQAFTEAGQLLGLAASYMALPLLGLAAAQLASDFHWPPQRWSQLILGIMVFFELSRWLDLQQAWLWLVNGIGYAGLLLALLRPRSQDARLRIPAAIALICLPAPLLLGYGNPLLALQQPDMRLLGLLPGLIGAAAMVGLLAEQAHNSDPSVEPPEERDA
ncbi:MAG: hypothetical protein WAV92_09450 [Halopseudomonas yangmingensis]